MSRRALTGRALLCTLPILGVSACTHAWDALDPNGGAGGASSTSASTTASHAGGAGGSSTQSTSSSTTASMSTSMSTGGHGGTGGSATTSSSSSSSSSGTGGSPPTHCAGTDLLSWDFSGFQDEVFGHDTEADVTGGQGIITLTPDAAGYQYYSYYSQFHYDLRGDKLTLEVADVPNQTDGAWGGIMAKSDNGDYIFIEAWKGYLDCGFNRGGTEIVPKKAPYDPVQHRYWQLREDQGTIHCETSADGSTWSDAGSYDLGASLLGAPSSVTVVIYAGAPPQVVAPGKLVVDNLNGGGPPTGKWCPAQSYTDDFADGPSVPAPAWQDAYAYNGASFDQAGDQVSFRFASAFSGAGYGSSMAYDLTGQRVAIEVVAIPTAASSGIYFSAANSDAYEVYWDVSADEILCQYDVNYNTMTAWQGAPPTPPFWMSIRESNGNIFCELFQNGAWQTYGSFPSPIDPTRTGVYFGIYAGASVVDGDYVATLDNYNLTPAP